MPRNLNFMQKLSSADKYALHEAILKSEYRALTEDIEKKVFPVIVKNGEAVIPDEPCTRKAAIEMAAESGGICVHFAPSEGGQAMLNEELESENPAASADYLVDSYLEKYIMSLDAYNHMDPADPAKTEAFINVDTYFDVLGTALYFTEDAERFDEITIGDLLRRRIYSLDEDISKKYLRLMAIAHYNDILDLTVWIPS